MFLTVYNRTPIKGEYPEGLAYSVHIAYSKDGLKFTPFHKNYGILFAKATITSENTISPKGIKNPEILFMGDGCWGIVATRIQESGDKDITSDGKLLVWKTKDFIHFGEEEWMEASDAKKYNPVTTMEIPDEVGNKAVSYWMPIVNTGIEVESPVTVTNLSQLKNVKVKALYSDGSTVEKYVDWETDTLELNAPGNYEVNGRVHHKKYEFPLTKGYGDPVLLKWENKWYFIATNDNLDDIGIYVREADEIDGLFKEDVTEHLILPLDRERGFVQTFWAPEFHMIGGELYILFAVSGEQWGPQCHYMKFKKGGSIIKEDSWENPVRIRKADGRPLAEGAITLDMTFIKVESGSYYVWSYREKINSPLDTGSMLYIATVDEKNPGVLTSEPVLLTRPLYGWENVEGTINNEGPYAFVKDGKVYLTYSGGAANGYTYALGLLTADGTDDLLELKNWKKSHYPVLSFYSVSGEYGPGHNSFFVNDREELMIAYHGETDIKEHLRCDGIRRVHFRNDGSPYFGMASEEDLKEEFRNVQMNVILV